MTAKLSIDGKWILIENATSIEIKQLRLSFTKKIPDWYIIKKKSPYAIVDESFISDYNVIPSGLWVELIKVCEKYRYNIEFIDGFDTKIKEHLDKSSFIGFVDNMFKNNDVMKPRGYQLDGVYDILTYKRCCVEISTSGGKTAMCYILFKYLRDVYGSKHILYVTPKTTLTTQSSDKFELYDKQCGIDSNWTYDELHAKAKKKSSYNADIVFGNYQSLCKKGPEFFNMFDCVIIDECHHSTSKSIRNIITKCVNAKYIIGLTGTFPNDGTYENYMLQSYIGPLVNRLTSYELIYEEENATPVYVIGIKMDYLEEVRKKALYDLRCNKDKDDPTVGNKLLEMEREISRKSYTRKKYICDMIKKTTKNTLVIFTDVKGEYGHDIYETIKDITSKSVFYIDGEVSVDKRDYAKAAMEEDETGNTVIISSINCFSEGVDISNLWNIFLIESVKSEVLVAQLLGRGMRSYPGKDKTLLFDFFDDYSYGNDYYSNNYLLRHSIDRLNIYKKRRFPYKSFNVDLNQQQKNVLC